MPRQQRLPGIDETTGPDKSARIDLRVTPAEKSELQLMARDLGVSVSALLLGAVFGDFAGKVILRHRGGKK